MDRHLSTRIFLGIIAVALSVLAIKNLDIIGTSQAGAARSDATPYNTTAGIMGEIRLFAGDFAPKGWAFCEGQQLEIEEYTALFGILGATYGGDGEFDFQLPDLRGRTPVGVGLGGRGYKQVKQGAKENYMLQEVAKYGGISKKDKKNKSLTLERTHPNMNPTNAQYTRRGQLGLRYIICMEGLLPSED